MTQIMFGGFLQHPFKDCNLLCLMKFTFITKQDLQWVCTQLMLLSLCLFNGCVVLAQFCLNKQRTVHNQVHTHPFDVKSFPGQTVMVYVFYEPASSGVFVVKKLEKYHIFYLTIAHLKTR